LSIEVAPERRRDNTSISHLLIEEMKDVNSTSVNSARGCFESCLFKSKEDSPDIVNRQVKSRSNRACPPNGRYRRDRDRAIARNRDPPTADKNLDEGKDGGHSSPPKPKLRQTKLSAFSRGQIENRSPVMRSQKSDQILQSEPQSAVKVRSPEEKDPVINQDEVWIDFAEIKEVIGVPSEQNQRPEGDSPEGESRPREKEKPGEEGRPREKEKPGEESRPREKEKLGEKRSKAKNSKVCSMVVPQALTFALMTVMVVVQLCIQKRRIEDEMEGHQWLTNVVVLSVVDILLAATLCLERTNRSAKASRLTLLGRYICCVMLHPLLTISTDFQLLQLLNLAHFGVCVASAQAFALQPNDSLVAGAISTFALIGRTLQNLIVSEATEE